MSDNGFLIFVLVALGGVIFINGWTDAPTAIATCVASGAMRERRAAMLAALCNLLGVALSFALNPTVTETVQGLVVLPQNDGANSLAVLLCGLLATGIWAVAAWFFGIPTSESHGLLAGLSGAAMAYGGAASIRGAVWIRILLGLGLSILGGLLLGGAVWIVMNVHVAKQRDDERGLGRSLLAGAAAMAFMHGAQDGQKFVGIWLLALSFGGEVGQYTTAIAATVCALLMGTGTVVCGGRIIRTLGEKLVKTGYREGFAADVGAAVCLLLLTLFGIPVSTTHTKTAALMGVGITKGRGRLDAATAAKMLGAWLLTFPACFGIGYFLMMGILRYTGG